MDLPSSYWNPSWDIYVDRRKVVGFLSPIVGYRRRIVGYLYSKLSSKWDKFPVSDLMSFNNGILSAEILKE